MSQISRLLEELRSALEAVAEPADAEPMRAYMRGQFDFFGIKSPARRQAARPTLRALRNGPPDELLAFAAACWDEPEREFQYVGADAMVAGSGRLGLPHLDAVTDLIVAKSWWDTVDTLGPRVVGTIVRDEPTGWARVDRWIDGSNMWLARCAITQQLRYGTATDADVLFDRCLRRADDPDFFIRKAIGWALRQYAKFEPDAVRRFLDQHAGRLSPLSIREATKHL